MIVLIVFRDAFCREGLLPLVGAVKFLHCSPAKMSSFMSLMRWISGWSLIYGENGCGVLGKIMSHISNHFSAAGSDARRPFLRLAIACTASNWSRVSPLRGGGGFGKDWQV